MKKSLHVFVFLFICFTGIHFSSFSQNCTVNAGVDRVLCPGSPVIVSGNIGGNFIPNTIVWTQVSGPNTATITSSTSISPTVSNLVTGVYVFQIKATCQIGGDAIDQCTYTVKAGATPVAPSLIFVGCYTPGTPISLTGTAPAGHTLTWHFESNSAPSTGTFNGTSQTTFTGNNPTIAFSAPSFDWCNNGFSGSQAIISVTSTNTASLCSETRTFSIYLTYNPGPVTASASAAVLCGPSSPVSLTGSCQGSGSGIWTVVSAPVSAPPVTFTPNNTTATVKPGNLRAGNYIFRWTVTGGACSTGSADVALSVSSSVTGSVTMPDITGKKYCPGTFPTAFALIGNVPAPGENCEWTQISGGAATILNASSPHAQATGLTEGGAPYVFRYTISSASGPCALSDTLLVGVSKSFSFGSTGLSTCLYASESSTGLGIGVIPFKQADSIPVSIIYESGPANNMQITFSARMVYTNGNSTGVGYYSPYYSITKGGTAVHTFYGNTLWPNFNQQNADIGFTFTTLNNIAACSNQIPGVYKFRAAYKDQCGTSISEPFTVTVNQVATFNAGSDQMLPCGNTVTTLAGNTVKCAVTPFWSTIKKPAAAPDPIDATNMYNANAPLNTLQNGSYIFLWHSNSVSDLCNLNNDSVRVTVAVTPPAVPVITGGGGICSNLPVTVSGALNDDAARGTWTVSSNPIGGTYTISPSVNSPVITFTPTTPNTIYTLTWTVQNGCGSAFASTTVTSGSTTAVIPNITNADDCSAYTFGTLTASPAGGVWTSSNPYYTLTSPGSTSTTVSPSTFNYWWNGPVTFYYTVPSGCGTLKDSVSFSTDNYPSLVANSFCNNTSFPATQTISLKDLQPYGKYEIYAVTGPGTATITPATFIPTSGTYNLSVTVSQSGQYSFGLRKRAGACVSSTTLVLQFSSVAALALAGPDINLCGSTPGTVLNAQPNPLGSGKGLWTVETLYSGYAPTIANSTLPNSAISFDNGGGDVLLKWKVMGDNAACGTGTEDYMRIKYMPAAYAGIDNLTCYSASTPLGSIAFGLNANNPLPGFGTWTIVSQPAGSNASFIDPHQHNTTITGLIGGIYNLRWTVATISETCISSDDVMLGVLYGCSVLPLELISFSALARNNDVHINWQLGTDEPGGKYILERAYDAEGPFTAITAAEYKAANNKMYSFIDAGAAMMPVKNLYYRLKMYTKDGILTYSKVVTVRLNKTDQISVYPTIVNKGEPVNIAAGNNDNRIYQARIVAVTGQLIRQMEIKNTGIVQIATGNLSAGIYIIQLQDGNNAYSYKIIVK